MTLCDALDDFEWLLPGTADIQRPTDGAVDGVGNPSRTWPTIRYNIAMSVQPSVSFSRWFEENQQTQNSVFDNVIFIQRDATYTPDHKDRITNYTVNGTTDAYTYEIRSVLDDGGEFDHWFVGANVVDT